MPKRHSILTFCLLIALSAFAVGCGDKETTPAPAQQGATPAAPSGTTGASATGGTGSVSATVKANAKLARDNCVAAAERLQDDARKSQAKEICEDAYNKVINASSNIDDRIKEAKQNCQREAKKIENEVARQRAEQACDSIQ